MTHTLCCTLFPGARTFLIQRITRLTKLAEGAHACAQGDQSGRLKANVIVVVSSTHMLALAIAATWAC